MNKLSAIILAGGNSSRMGEDKGLMTLYGKPMVQYVLETAQNIADEILIIANNNNYQQFGYPVFEDPVKGKGPLVGMSEGLKNSTNDLNLILSCDVPYVETSLLEFIYKNRKNHDAVICKHKERLHPLIGLYRKSCASIFDNQIANKMLKITDSFDNLDVKYLNTDQFDDQMFRNINSKGDL